MDFLSEFSTPISRAKNIEDRLNDLKKYHKNYKNIPEKIGYGFSFGNFSTRFKLPTKGPEALPPILFKANHFGFKEGKKIRNKMLKNGFCVSFHGKDYEIITEICDHADFEATKKINGNCNLVSLKWTDFYKIKDDKNIWNISFKSCINKKGQFDAVSWIFFYNSYIEFYYNLIHLQII